jgi:hypothetical protein
MGILGRTTGVPASPPDFPLTRRQEAMPQPARYSMIARLVYSALVASVGIATSAALIIRGRTAPTRVPQLLLYAPLVVGAATFGAAFAVRSGIEPPGSGVAEDAWWSVQFPRALVVWALIEGASMFGAAVFLICGAYLPLAPTVVGFLLLALVAPARLAET